MFNIFTISGALIILCGLLSLIVDFDKLKGVDILALTVAFSAGWALMAYGYMTKDRFDDEGR